MYRNRPHYNMPIFSGLPNSTIDLLQSMLQAAAHIIMGVRKYDHITLSLHWLPVKETYNIQIVPDEALHGMTPSYIAEFCRPVAATNYRSRLRSATYGDLVVPRNSLDLGKRAFAVAGPTAWNNLLLSVRLAPSITTFKTALKTHLFSAAYGASKHQ